MRFERAEVAALANSKIALYPHLTVVPRTGLAKRAFKVANPEASSRALAPVQRGPRLPESTEAAQTNDHS
jgi:hypothetical protein